MLTGEQRGVYRVSVCLEGVSYRQVSPTWHLTELSCVWSCPAEPGASRRAQMLCLPHCGALRGGYEGGQREPDTLSGPGLSSVMVLTVQEVGGHYHFWMVPKNDRRTKGFSISYDTSGFILFDCEAN